MEKIRLGLIGCGGRMQAHIHSFEQMDNVAVVAVADPVEQRRNAAAERFGCSPDRCILLEDAPDNCAAASAAGFTVVGVYDDFYSPRWADVAAHSHRTVRSLEDLLPDLNGGAFSLTASPCTERRI